MLLTRVMSSGLSVTKLYPGPRAVIPHYRYFWTNGAGFTIKKLYSRQSGTPFTHQTTHDGHSTYEVQYYTRERDFQKVGVSINAIIIFPQQVLTPTQSKFSVWDMSIMKKFHIQSHLTNPCAVPNIKVQLPRLPVDCITYDSTDDTLIYTPTTEAIQCAIRISGNGETSWGETVIAYNRVDPKLPVQDVLPTTPHLGRTIPPKSHTFYRF